MTVGDKFRESFWWGIFEGIYGYVASITSLGSESQGLTGLFVKKTGANFTVFDYFSNKFPS